MNGTLRNHEKKKCNLFLTMNRTKKEGLLLIFLKITFKFSNMYLNFHIKNRTFKGGPS